ncbi:MAG: glycosyltransferase [Nanoarchaeota archaeon]
MKTLCVIDMQKKHFGGPLGPVYRQGITLFQQTSMRARIIPLLKKQQGLITITLDHRSEEELSTHHLGFISKRELTDDIWSYTKGKTALTYLRNLEKQLTKKNFPYHYKGYNLIDLALKDIWRMYALPITSFIDELTTIITKEKPDHILLLTNNTYQDILENLTLAHHIPIIDKRPPLRRAGRTLKMTLIKHLAALTTPTYIRQPRPRRPTPRKMSSKKKILIVHDSIHAPKIIPWATTLAKEYDVMFIGQNQDPSSFSCITYKKHEDYLTQKVITAIKKQNKIYTSSTVDILNKLTYRKANIGPAFEELFTFLKNARFSHITALIEIFEEMIRQERPDLVITIDEISTHGKTLISIAKKHGIPTTIMEHGIIARTPLLNGTRANLILVYSNWVKKTLLQMHIPEQRIRIVGMPEEIRAYPQAHADIIKRYDIPLKKKHFLLASQGISESYNYPFLDTVYRAITHFPDIHLLTKLHPDENSTLHDQLIKKYKLNNVTIIPHGTTPLQELIEASHCVINFCSAVNIESLTRGKFLISVNINHIPDNIIPTPVPNLITTAYTYQETVRAIRSFAKKKPEKNAIILLSKQYIAYQGQEACNHVLQEINKLVPPKS